MKIINEEYDQIIKELSNRVRDFIFINVEKKIKKEMSKKCIERYLKNHQDTEIIYSFHIIVGDLWQILGRTRRTKR